MSDRYDSQREMGDFHAGLICSVIANVNRDPKKKREAFTARDFMPDYTNSREKPTAPQLHNYWKEVVMPYFSALTDKET